MSVDVIKRPRLIALLALAPLCLTACGETVSTGNFNGESKAVAQTIANFQNDVSTASESNICQKDLASALRAHLNSTGSGCQEAIKNQLGQIDTFTLTIDSVAVKGSSATAKVSSTYSGKNTVTTLALVKEGAHWKISGSGAAATAIPKSSPSKSSPAAKR
jgi:hypothetical protein